VDWPAIRSSELRESSPPSREEAMEASFAPFRLTFGSERRMVEPEVVATSPCRIKSPMPVYCGFSSKKLAAKRHRRRKSEFLFCDSCVFLWLTKLELAGGFAPALAMLSTSCLCSWTTRASGVGQWSTGVVEGCRDENRRGATNTLLRRALLQHSNANPNLEPPAGAAPAGLLYKRNPQAAA
jgi:hypothetical protein